MAHLKRLTDLHEYQHTAVSFLLRVLRGMLFIDVGMGKTIISLTVLARLLASGSPVCALVVAPLRVAKATWPAEIAEWEHLSALTHQLIRAEDTDPDIDAVFKAALAQATENETRWGETGKDIRKFAGKTAAKARQRAKENKRRAQARVGANVNIINIERVEWLVRYWNHLEKTRGLKWPYNIIIIDESSKFKEYKTRRYRALSSVVKKSEMVFLLTASPAAEGYMGLFAQTFLVDLGARFGRFITHFRNAYFTEIKKARKWVIRSGAEREIARKIAPVCLVMKAEDHRDALKTEDALPLVRRIVLPDSVLARLKDFEKTHILKLQDAAVEARNSSALFNKLMQAASGTIYDEGHNILGVHEEKIEALRELKDELQGSPLLVPYWFRSSLAQLRAAFPHAVIMDKAGDCVAPWNAGKIDMLLIQAAGSAHGLNMQKGPGHDLCWFDLPWSRELYEQMIGRLARQGQRQLVRNHHLVCVGSHDERVLPVLQEKGDGQDRMFSYIREYHREVSQAD